ncbi:Ankyrin repeat-containing domain protein [Lactarius tabidus]
MSTNTRWWWYEKKRDGGGAIGTTLQAAAGRNYVEVGQVLLRHGADINSPGKWQQTPLQLATLLGRLEIVQWPVTHGADVNVKDDMQWTPLHGTTLHRHLEIPPFNGRSAFFGYCWITAPMPWHVRSTNRLHCSLRRPTGNWEVVPLLLEHGVDVDAADDMGHTPYQIALDKEYDDVAQLLLARGVKNIT